MADDKKNIGPEAEKPGEAPKEKTVEPIKDMPPSPEQPAFGAPQALRGGKPVRGSSVSDEGKR